jgi:hypothetical protein
MLQIHCKHETITEKVAILLQIESLHKEKQIEF